MVPVRLDIVRTLPTTTRWKRPAVAVAIVAALAATTLGLSRLRPAARSVDRATVVIETVRRGPLTREVRGSGVLVPEDIRWISTALDARVERIALRPGTSVKADTILMELSNDSQQQTARDAEFQLRAAIANYETVRAQLENERLDREASLARLRAEHEQARLRATADAQLEREGLVPHITAAMSKSTADELARRLAIEEERLRVSAGSQQSRLSAARTAIEQSRSLRDLHETQARALIVRAGIDGVLQQVNVQEGQRVAAGTAIARVARPDRLQAQIRIAETQAKDIAVGQRATVDTRNGVVAATVARIDPAVREGTVTVDLRIDAPLPAGARPDLSVDAVIELERIAETTFVSRPVIAQEGSAGQLYRLTGADGAERVRVTYGRGSATAIEVRGLAPGDRVIVSDTTAYDSSRRIALH